MRTLRRSFHKPMTLALSLLMYGPLGCGGPTIQAPSMAKSKARAEYEAKQTSKDSKNKVIKPTGEVVKTAGNEAKKELGADEFSTAQIEVSCQKFEEKDTKGESIGPGPVSINENSFEVTHGSWKAQTGFDSIGLSITSNQVKLLCKNKDVKQEIDSEAKYSCQFTGEASSPVLVNDKTTLETKDTNDSLNFEVLLNKNLITIQNTKGDVQVSARRGSELLSLLFSRNEKIQDEKSWTGIVCKKEKIKTQAEE